MKKSYFAATTALMFVLLISLFVSDKASVVVASTSQGSDYQSKMATSTMSSATTSQLFKLGSGSIGSVVIINTSAGALPIKIWDATSTATSTYMSENNASLTDTYGRLVASFTSNAATGTYTFDSTVFKGVVVEIPQGFSGTYVVTYR